MDSPSLLTEYVRHPTPQAFGRLVEQYVDIVYESARRQVRDAHLAEDVTQAVFILLLQKARRIPLDRPLSAWLLKTTGFVAANARRDRMRRRNREMKAASMTRKTDIAAETDESRKEVSLLLDEGIAWLRTSDRDALLLRFFENKSHRLVGQAMGISQDAAEKRVTRAVERLRDFLRRRGVSVGSVALTNCLGGRPGAPPELAAAIARGAHQTASAGAALAKGASIVMKTTQLKIGICAAALVLAAGVSVSLVRTYLSQPQLDNTTRLLATANDVPPPAAEPIVRAVNSPSGSAMVVVGGTVQNEESKPISGVGIALKWTLPASQQKGPGTNVHIAQTTTDAKGQWSCADVPRESLAGLQMRLAQKEYSAVTITGVSPDQLAGQSAAMTMTRGVDLPGLVVDPNEQPVSGAAVTTATDWSFTDPGAPSATTDAGGQFTLHHVAANQKMTLITRSPRFAPAAQDVLTGGAIPPLRIALTAGRTLTGQVMDDRGRPVAGARVLVYQWDGGFHADVQTTSLADGTYEMRHTPVRAIKVSAGKSGFSSSGVEDVDDGQNQMNFTLTSMPTFRGTVVDAATHQPIPEFKVLYTAVRSRDQGPPSFPDWSARTFHDGLFDGVIPNRFGGQITGWRLRIEAHGYLPSVSPVLEESAAQDFSLARGTDIEGRVFGLDGKPAAGVVLEMAVPDAPVGIWRGDFTNVPRPRAVTNAQGHFVFAAQPPPFLLAAISYDGIAQTDADALAKNSDLHLTAWGRITGQLLVGGKPAANEDVGAMLASDRRPFDQHRPTVTIGMQTRAACTTFWRDGAQ